jgi:hypothetical protein
MVREGTGVVEVRCSLCPGVHIFGEPFFDAFPFKVEDALLFHRKGHKLEWESDALGEGEK